MNADVAHLRYELARRGPSPWWDDRAVETLRFTAAVIDDGRGGALIVVPVEPDKVWGPKSRHHVAGTINKLRIRAVIESDGGAPALHLGPAWLRDCPLRIGDEAVIEIGPEGPQRGDLADDVAAALDANPEAGEFFDSLAQFYRRGYLRWIDSTKRSPALRQERIAAMVEMLSAGVKDYRTNQP